MTVGFEPSVEMIEAGARALCETASDGIDNYDDLDDVAQEMFREWSEANLRAALGLVLLDPCPTCVGMGVLVNACVVCHGTAQGPPVWAWLRAAQNSGVAVGGWVMPWGVWWSDVPQVTGDAPQPLEPFTVFRVSVPGEGT